FVTALVNMARQAKRVSMTNKPVENEKYAWRCFLLRLGFIGEEFKQCRKVLLSNFSGSSAFKNK
ncbi:MAG: virulence protein, partial [Erysipelotrichaceae bacterium]|nr:virulence protein [Erysipelotrichaceae bacterium]